jgi:hypothetical protein
MQNYPSKYITRISKDILENFLSGKVIIVLGHVWGARFTDQPVRAIVQSGCGVIRHQKKSIATFYILKIINNKDTDL